jgi:hypothetical protein
MQSLDPYRGINHIRRRRLDLPTLVCRNDNGASRPDHNGASRADPVDEDLVAVELLSDLGIHHRADDQRANRLVAVLQLMRSPPADRTGDDFSRPEFADAVERGERQPPGQDDDHLLVAVMEVKRRAVPSGVDLVQRCAEPLACAPTRAARPISGGWSRWTYSGSKMFANCAN